MQICSAHTWAKLSEEDRRIILECAAESALYERELWTQREETSRLEALENGTMETVLSPEEKIEFQERMSDIYIKYCSEYMDVIDRIIEEGNRNTAGSNGGAHRDQHYMKAIVNIERGYSQR